MKKLPILAAAIIGLVVITHDVMAQRRGVVRGGVRGAAVGGMLGGESGKEKGAKIGAVTTVTRNAINRESQARTQYQSSEEYKNYEGSNFNESPPDFIAVTDTSAVPTTAGEAIIRKDGKPLVGITFPSDWKQRTGENYISAVSSDGHAWSMLATIKQAADKPAGVKKIKEGLKKYLNDVKYDKISKTKRGAIIVTGTGKGKKSGIDVVYAAGVFDAGNGQLVGAAFVVDSKIEDHYKATIRGICETIRRSDDFAEQK